MKLVLLKFISVTLLSVLLISCASSEKRETAEVKSIETHAKSLAHGTAKIACTIV